MLVIWMTYFSWNINNFSTDMSVIFDWMKPSFTGFEGLVLSKCGEFNALKQAIRDQIASFNQEKCNVWHINDPWAWPHWTDWTKRILRSYPWKNYKNFNWNRSLIRHQKYFAWLKLALWSRIACFAALNLWHFRRLSTLNVSQAWFQWDKYCAHVRGKIKYILTEMGYLYAQKYILLDWNLRSDLE